MKVEQIEFDKHKALNLYNTYRAHRGAHTKEDAEIERIYYHISRGRKVIRAFESIRAAGLDAQGLPKLAIVRADLKRCAVRVWSSEVEFFNPRSGSNRIAIPWRTGSSTTARGEAMVPLIPVHLRPAQHLERYHILWEADWQRVPVDPMLLRRINGDLWLVVAAWDLTAIEQAVLAGRL